MWSEAWQPTTGCGRPQFASLIRTAADEGSGTAFLDGGAGNDYLETGTATGNATMNGGPDDDFIRYNGAGAATIDGGAGRDRIFGGAGADHILGGDGDDEIDGRSGNDFIDAGAGNDVVYWTVEDVAHHVRERRSLPRARDKASPCDLQPFACIRTQVLTLKITVSAGWSTNVARVVMRAALQPSADSI